MPAPALSPFWLSIPRKSLSGFMLGVFLIFTTVGFSSDILEMGRTPAPRFVLGVLMAGVFSVLYADIGFRLRAQAWKAFLPLFIVHFFLMGLLANAFTELPQPKLMDATAISHLQTRLLFDSLSIIAAIGLGYGCFVFATIGESRRYAHVYAEILLATEIHRVLVPPIDTQIGPYEFCGRSLPSSEVGGNLIDVFAHGQEWIAYVADVSGHGVAPGVVTAMVKSAARMQLSSAEKSTTLLERLNAVLVPIKKPEMFVTFAYISWNGDHLQFSTAGHPAILHYQAASQQIAELESSTNLPVGMFAGRSFDSASFVGAPGDLLLLLTDGVIEITNAKDEEFGLASFERRPFCQRHSSLAQNSRRSLGGNRPPRLRLRRSFCATCQGGRES